jgi:hypothetical protein
MSGAEPLRVQEREIIGSIAMMWMSGVWYGRVPGGVGRTGVI